MYFHLDDELLDLELAHVKGVEALLGYFKLFQSSLLFFMRQFLIRFDVPETKPTKS